jgi:hypothetical protein
MDESNENGLVSAIASILTGLFGHRFASRSLQTTDFRCRFDRPDAYINRLGDMLIRRQTRSLIQPVVVHS